MFERLSNCPSPSNGTLVTYSQSLLATLLRLCFLLLRHQNEDVQRWWCYHLRRDVLLIGRGQRLVGSVRNMVFFGFFLLICTTPYDVLPSPHSFLSVSLFRKRTIRVLLISKRSRAQRTTTTGDPFQALSKRPRLRVVLQVHLPLVAPLDLPQQDVSFFTR